MAVDSNKVTEMVFNGLTTLTTMSYVSYPKLYFKKKNGFVKRNSFVKAAKEEGQMNQSIAEMENVLDPVSEEEHLRSIWQELGVGTDGYLTLNELASVCEHIGMDEMNPEELEHLFDKLDVDTDGRVSFKEFLQGLFQHGGPTSTPSGTPVRPLSATRPLSAPRSLSTPRQKLRLSASVHSLDDRQTPSLVATGSGLFSVLDQDNTGYATVDAIIELWDGMGVAQGAEILEYLQFDLNTKVNLADLTFALEQELRGLEEDNATYQAAVVSYQQELKHLKTTSETASAEREKFKTDLAEANNRILILVKEGDDRQASLERSREKELLSVETKYQEQIKSLQSEIEQEREVLANQSTKQREKMETEIEKLKDEETKLKEKLNQTQQELERLETDIVEMSEKCSDLEKQNHRQQKELDAAAEFHRKMEEIESDRDQIVTEEQQFYQQKLKQVETDKTELQDKNDELTMEVEELRQQLSSQRRQRRTDKKESSVDTPQRTGSILSDYAKPTIVSTRDSTDDQSENSEDDATSPRRRRQLPDRPNDSGLDSVKVEELREQVEELQSEKQHLQDEKEKFEQKEQTLQQEMQQLQQDKDQLQVENKQFLEEAEKLQSREEALSEKIEKLKEQVEELKQQLEDAEQRYQQDREDMEQAFKVEVTELEETHKEEKDQLTEAYQKDLEALEERLSKKLEEQEEEIKKDLEQEKQDLVIHAESEKNLLTQNYAEEKADLIARMRTELEEEMEVKLQQQRAEFDQQLEDMVSHDREDYDKLKKQKAETELRMKLQKEELEMEFEKEKMKLHEKQEQEKSALEERHRLEILDYENMFSRGQDGLKGRLKDDFNTMVEQHRLEVEQMERRKLQQQLEEDRAEMERVERRKMEEELQREKVKMDKELMLMSSKDKDRLEGQIQDDMKKLEQAHQEQLGQLQLEQEQLQQQLQKEQLQLQKERQIWEKERHSLKEGVEHEASRDVQTRLEEEFMQQLQRLKGAFEGERQELESRIQLLQDEVNDLSSHHDDQEMLRQNAEGKSRDLEGKYRRQLDELKRTNSNLIQEKRLMEQDHISRYQSLEDRLHQLIMEREEVTPTANLSNTQTVPNGHTSFLENFDREKNILSAIEGQRTLLESKTRELKHQIQGLNSASSQQQQQQQLSPLQHAHDKLLAEKQALEEILHATEEKLRNMLDESLAAERYKAQLQSWETEKDALKQQLDLTTDRLADTNTALSIANSEHVRQVQTLRDESNQKIEVSKYNNLNLQLVEAQRRVQELEAALEQRAAETSKLIIESQEDHKRLSRELEEERDDVRYKLGQTQALLDQQVQKLKLQLEKSARTDLLVKDLYVENSNLVKCLQLTEKREKDAEGRLISLEEKCMVLQRLLRQICPTVMS